MYTSFVLCTLCVLGSVLFFDSCDGFNDRFDPPYPYDNTKGGSNKATLVRRQKVITERVKNGRRQNAEVENNANSAGGNANGKQFKAQKSRGTVEANAGNSKSGVKQNPSKSTKDFKFRGGSGTGRWAQNPDDGAQSLSQVKGRRNTIKTKHQVKKHDKESRAIVERGGRPQRFNARNEGNEAYGQDAASKKGGRIDNPRKGASQYEVDAYRRKDAPKDPTKTAKVRQTNNQRTQNELDFIVPGLTPFDSTHGELRRTSSSRNHNTKFQLRKTFGIGKSPDFDARGLDGPVGYSDVDTSNTANIGFVKKAKSINKPVASAKAKRFREVPCTGDFDNLNDKDPNGFKYLSSTVKYDNVKGQTFEFPGCFNIAAKVRIPPNVALSDLAVRLYMYIPGCKQFDCGEAARCNGANCFYENICQSEPGRGGGRHKDVGSYLFTATASDACDQNVKPTVRTETIKVRYCPDPKAVTNYKDACPAAGGLFSGFGRGIGSIGKVASLLTSKSTVIVQMDMFRIKDRNQFSCKKGGLFNFRANNAGQYISKVACKAVVVDYSLKKQLQNHDNNEEFPDCNNANNQKKHPICLYASRDDGSTAVTSPRGGRGGRRGGRRGNRRGG